MIAAARSMHFSNAFDSHFEYSSKQRSLRQLFSSNPVGAKDGNLQISRKLSVERTARKAQRRPIAGFHASR